MFIHASILLVLATLLFISSEKFYIPFSMDAQNTLQVMESCF